MFKRLEFKCLIFSSLLIWLILFKFEMLDIFWISWLIFFDFSVWLAIEIFWPSDWLLKYCDLLIGCWNILTFWLAVEIFWPPDWLLKYFDLLIGCWNILTFWLAVEIFWPSDWLLKYFDLLIGYSIECAMMFIKLFIEKRTQLSFNDQFQKIKRKVKSIWLFI